MSILLLATAISGHAATCDELAVGESLRQDFDGKESLTGLEQRYTLYRESVDRYEVIVNPLFIADTREAEKALKDKLITCLNEKSEAFSSKSEITIKLKVYDESTDKIKSTSTLRWSESRSCPPRPALTPEVIILTLIAKL